MVAAGVVPTATSGSIIESVIQLHTIERERCAQPRAEVARPADGTDGHGVRAGHEVRGWNAPTEGRVIAAIRAHRERPRVRLR